MNQISASLIEPKQQDWGKSKSTKNNSGVDSLIEDVSKPKTRGRSSQNTKTADSDKELVSYDSRKKNSHVNEHNVRASIKTVHEKLRPFQCNVCKQTFGHKSNLSRHKKNIHRSKKK